MPPTIPTGQKLQPVTVTFTNHGAQPPIYIAGDFTKPAWNPQLMEVEQGDGDDLVFKSIFHLPAGQYQYKFRLGAGNWWICDTSSKTIDTDIGITNNLLIVQDEADSTQEGTDDTSDADRHSFSAASSSAATQAASDPSTAKPQPSNVRSSARDYLNSSHRDRASMHVDVKPTDKQTAALKERFAERGRDPYAGIGGDDATPLDGPEAPLLPHEIGAPPPTPPDDCSETPKALPNPASPADAHNGKASGSLRKSRSISMIPQAPTAEDLNDRNIERFPEDRQNVLKRIQTLKYQLPEDETRDFEATKSSEDVFSDAEEGDESAAVEDEPSSPARLSANAAARSHEHLDSVPEYDDPTSPLLETGTESADSGSDLQDKDERQRQEPPTAAVLPDTIASTDGAFDERRHVEHVSPKPIRRINTTKRPNETGQETDDEGDYASSDTPLLPPKNVGWVKLVWFWMQNASRRLWDLLTRAFQKAKSD